MVTVPVCANCGRAKKHHLDRMGWLCEAPSLANRRPTKWADPDPEPQPAGPECEFPEWYDEDEGYCTQRDCDVCHCWCCKRRADGCVCP